MAQATDQLASDQHTLVAGSRMLAVGTFSGYFAFSDLVALSTEVGLVATGGVLLTTAALVGSIAFASIGAAVLVARAVGPMRRNDLETLEEAADRISAYSDPKGSFYHEAGVPDPHDLRGFVLEKANEMLKSAEEERPKPEDRPDRNLQETRDTSHEHNKEPSQSTEPSDHGPEIHMRMD